MICEVWFALSCVQILNDQTLCCLLCSTGSHRQAPPLCVLCRGLANPLSEGYRGLCVIWCLYMIPRSACPKDGMSILLSVIILTLKPTQWPNLETDVCLRYPVLLVVIHFTPPPLILNLICLKHKTNPVNDSLCQCVSCVRRKWEDSLWAALGAPSRERVRTPRPLRKHWIILCHKHTGRICLCCWCASSPTPPSSGLQQSFQSFFFFFVSLFTLTWIVSCIC